MSETRTYWDNECKWDCEFELTDMYGCASIQNIPTSTLSTAPLIGTTKTAANDVSFKNYYWDDACSWKCWYESSNTTVATECHQIQIYRSSENNSDRGRIILNSILIFCFSFIVPTLILKAVLYYLNKQKMYSELHSASSHTNTHNSDLLPTTSENAANNFWRRGSSQHRPESTHAVSLDQSDISKDIDSSLNDNIIFDSVWKNTADSMTAVLEWGRGLTKYQSEFFSNNIKDETSSTSEDSDTSNSKAKISKGGVTSMKWRQKRGLNTSTHNKLEDSSEHNHEGVI